MNGADAAAEAAAFRSPIVGEQQRCAQHARVETRGDSDSAHSLSETKAESDRALRARCGAAAGGRRTLFDASAQCKRCREATIAGAVTPNAPCLRCLLACLTADRWPSPPRFYEDKRVCALRAPRSCASAQRSLTPGL